MTKTLTIHEIETAIVNPVTHVYKGNDGFRAKTDISLPNRGVLTLSTYKSSSGGLVSNATRQEDTGNGFLSYMMYSDFSERQEWDRLARCTEKNVKAQHDKHLANIKEILLKVSAFYLEKENKGE